MQKLTQRNHIFIGTDVAALLQNYAHAVTPAFAMLVRPWRAFRAYMDLWTWDACDP
jgi:hypothetical protein